MYQVYRIVNILNEKVYIGRSKDAKNRFKSHEYTANGGRGYQLHSAIRKHGIDNFKLDILSNHEFLSDCVKKEEYFIKISCSYEKGYNASKGGPGEVRSENITRWFNKTRKNTSGHKLKKIGQMILCDYKTYLLYIKPEEI